MQLFKRARFSAKVLILGSILIPALLFLAVAWLDYRATTARARDYVIVATNALAEQTKEALQTASLILARTLDRIDGMDWPAIMTGYADASVLSSWAASGYRTINKPFSATDLGAAINIVVATRPQTTNIVSATELQLRAAQHLLNAG